MSHPSSARRPGSGPPAGRGHRRGLALGPLWLFSLLASLLVTGQPLGAQPHAPYDPPTVYPAERGWRGVLAMAGERVVAEESSERLFAPASVEKLLVATAALHYLGPDHRIVTRLGGGVPSPEGVLAGDLLVEAAGDPTWSSRFHPGDPDAPLAELAGQLRARGVRRVSGDLVIDSRRFAGRPFPPSRALGELAYGFAAPVAALAVDDNTFRIEMAPGARVGEPCRLTVVDGADVELVNELRTVGAERDGDGTVDFLPDWRAERVVARGEYPLSEPSYRLDLAQPDGELYAGRALRRVLAAHGVTLAGGVRRATSADPPIRHELARVVSPPLAQRLEPILTDSHNWHAEMLLRTLALEVAGEGRSATGLATLRRFLVETVGVGADHFALDDASGISPYNLLTPRAVVELLRWSWHQPWRGSLVAALAHNGEGTLHSWPALPKLSAKTGTLRGSLALAGYVEQGPGSEPIVFAIFLGHRPGERPPLRAEIASWLRRVTETSR